MTMLEALNDSNNIKLFLDKKLDFLIEKIQLILFGYMLKITYIMKKFII